MVGDLWIATFFLAIAIFSIFVIYASFGFILYLALFLYETPNYFRAIIKGFKAFRANFVPKKDEYLCYPSDLEQANARLIVLSDFLASNPSKKEINDKFRLFHDGLELYNSYLKTHYGFVLCDIDHFYSSSKLALHSASNEEAVKTGLTDLTKQMGEHKEPYEIVGTLKRMIKEPATFKELCTDLEVEPKKVRKWFAKQETALIFTVTLPAVFTAIAEITTEPTFAQSLNSIIQVIQAIISSL